MGRRRRHLLFAAAVTLAASAPAAIAGGEGGGRTLVGSLEGVEGATATVRISHYSRGKQDYRRYRYEFAPITVYCDGDGQQRIARPVIDGDEATWIRSENRDLFGYNAAFLEPGAAGVQYLFKVDGELVRPRLAEGFVRMRGDHVPLQGGGSADCDSGRLRFTATLPLRPPQ
jgi:hypothetical protein